MRSGTRKKLVELHHRRTTIPAVTVPSYPAMMRVFFKGEEIEAHEVSIQFEDTEILAMKPRCCGTDVDARKRRT